MELVDKDGKTYGTYTLKIFDKNGKPKNTGSGGGAPTGPAGGDLTGTYPNPGVNWTAGEPTYDLLYYPLSSNPAGYLVTADLSPYITSTTAASTYEPIITAGSSAQYWRGDKTWQSLASAILGQVLTGLSLATSQTIASTDTIIQALGYIQAQITANIAAIATKVTSNAAITGATKTKVTYDSKGLVTAGVDATTADINDSTNRRYITDAQLVVVGNTSGTNTGDNAVNTTSNAYADSKVIDSIIDGDTTNAPSRNAVYDADAALQTQITTNTSAIADNANAVNLFNYYNFI